MNTAGGRPAGDSLVDDLDASKAELRAVARSRLGVTAEGGVAPPMRAVLAEHGLSLYPLVALGALSIVDTFHGYAFSVLTPEISGALGIGKGAVAGGIALKTLASASAPLAMAALAARPGRRVRLCLMTGVLWSLVAILTGYTTALLGLLAVLVLDGLTTGSVAALHGPLLVDSYPPEGRVRALSWYAGFNSFGNVLAPLLVAGLVTYAALTWRGVFVVLGVLSLVAVVVAARLRDPGIGRWDAELIRSSVRALHGETADRGVPDADVTLGFFEIVRRLLLISSARRILVGFAVLGVLLVPYQTFLFFFLEEEWGLGPAQRGVFFAYLAAIQVVALGLFGRRAEDAFRADPARVLRVAGGCLAAGVTCICLAALSPWFWPMILAFGVAAGFLATIAPSFNVSLLSVVPPESRPHMSALAGIFLGGVGGMLGATFLAGIDRRFGVGGSIVSLLVPGLLGSFIIATSGKLVPADLDRLIDRVIEDEEIRRIEESGGHLPLLACRGISFSYGQLQVLFDVDLTIEEGELVALLGVNGAGKSTLLKVISGIGLPSDGSVRMRGTDVTFLDAERRVRLGITQIPGGRAVFGSMSVVDNLRAFAQSLGVDSRSVDAGLDRSFDAFPRLAERRNQLASTLSGGEQQMLALSKALILRPRLLLIDELSLGLAPRVVEQLLGMVRSINADGTAVVLVEQSVNVALSVASHAYFMEKGEIRFDGRSQDLLGRGDLLRAVFLHGASKGVDGAVAGNGSAAR